MDYNLKISTDKTKIMAFKGKHLVRSKIEIDGSILEPVKQFNYSKTCLKGNVIVPVFFSVFTGFRFTKGCVLIKQSTKNMIA